jgi:hypothetical protein
VTDGHGPPETIVCVDCGGRCHRIGYLAPDEPVAPGTVVPYRCEDCRDRWDVEWHPDE